MDNKAWIGLLCLIGIILFNIGLLYGIIKDAKRGESPWMRALRNSLKNPTENSNKPYDDLRKRMQELNKDKKKEE